MSVPLLSFRQFYARRLFIFVCFLAAFVALPGRLPAQGVPKFDLTPGPLELAGPANPWRFVNAVGEKSGLWGFENGTLEGWVYPLKIFHDFQLAFELEGLGKVHRLEEAQMVLPRLEAEFDRLKLSFEKNGWT